MTKTLSAIEKLEEASRKDFNLTGCVARVSFARWGNSNYGKNVFANYGYQLGVYRNVCHVTQHIVKTVDEYRTVFRVDINPFLANFITPGGTGEFFLTADRNKSIRYQILIDAKQGPDYEKDRNNNPGRISHYFSEAALLTGRSDNYKNKHADFLKLINGDGYVNRYESGSRDDKPDLKSYK